MNGSDVVSRRLIKEVPSDWLGSSVPVKRSAEHHNNYPLSPVMSFVLAESRVMTRPTDARSAGAFVAVALVPMQHWHGR